VNGWTERTGWWGEVGSRSTSLNTRVKLFPSQSDMRVQPAQKPVKTHSSDSIVKLLNERPVEPMCIPMPGSNIGAQPSAGYPVSKGRRIDIPPCLIHRKNAVVH
jgi:hypothetical protein